MSSAGKTSKNHPPPHRLSNMGTNSFTYFGFRTTKVLSKSEAQKKFWSFWDRTCDIAHRQTFLTTQLSKLQHTEQSVHSLIHFIWYRRTQQKVREKVYCAEFSSVLWYIDVLVFKLLWSTFPSFRWNKTIPLVRGESEKNRESDTGSSQKGYAYVVFM